MSTKVYDAYKYTGKAKDFWAFVWTLQARAEEEVSRRLANAYWKALCRLDELPPEVDVRMTAVRTKFREGYKEAQQSSYKNEYNFDVSIAITPHNGCYYLRAFWDRTSLVHGCLDFLDELPDLRDYHYQNSSDRPKDVTAREWLRRRKAWDAMCNPKTDVIRHVALDICNKDNFWRLDPWISLVHKYKEAPPTFPSSEELYASELKDRHFEASWGPGFIKATKEGVDYEIHQIDNSWIVTVNGVAEVATFPKIREAFHRLDYHGLPPGIKHWIDSQVTKQQEAAQC